MAVHTESGAKREKGEASGHSGEAVEKWGLSTLHLGVVGREGFIWQDQPASAKLDGTEVYPKGSEGPKGLNQGQSGGKGQGATLGPDHLGP